MNFALLADVFFYTSEQFGVVCEGVYFPICRLFKVKKKTKKTTPQIFFILSRYLLDKPILRYKVLP